MERKLVLVLALILSVFLPAVGQTVEGTTSDGRKILLFPDGTWKYAEPVKPPPSPTAEQEIKEFITDEQIDSVSDVAAIKEIFNTPPRKLAGKVISVHDGDTVTLLDEQNQKYKVRFNGIDAPELKQDFGSRSRQNLANLVLRKNAQAVCPKIDKYGRHVCTVFHDNQDLNLEQVKAGFAWHYKKYQDEQQETERKAYAEAELNARSFGLGLWSQPNPTEPGAWRRGENNPNVAGIPKTAVIGNTNSMVYHTPGCSSWAKVSPQNRIIFATEKEAIDNGYRLSGQCLSTLPVEQRPRGNPPQPKRVYQSGMRGGCYYLNPSGKKVYVEKSFCQAP